MSRRILAVPLAAIAVSVTIMTTGPAAQDRPWLIAHRGASAYAPENTVPAFTLAADQGATFVELDLRLTRDGQLICLHDETLERTTDVAAVYPDRGHDGPNGTRRWPLAEFTLAELARLDAGAWFAPRFRGTRLPTLRDAIVALKGRAGLYIELKSPETYPGMEKLILDELARHGLDRPGADPKTPILLQSFTASSLAIFRTDLRTRLPVHFLVSARDAKAWLTTDGLERLRGIATGLSPEKTILLEPVHAAALARLRETGFPITPYTFRASAVPGFPDVRSEMTHYLDVLKVDGVITDNPDQMPARRR